MLAIAQAGIRAADPYAIVWQALTADTQRSTGEVWVVAVGKAAVAMSRAAQARLGDQLRGGIVIAPAGTQAEQIPPPLTFFPGQHPEPGALSEAAGRAALALCQSLPSDARVLVLLSGGASALMAAPAPGLTLEEKRLTTSVLLRGGADIHALNTVRKHASAIKGGWLAAVTAAPCRTLAISDVIGDDLSVIGSGPTVADPSTFADAFNVLAQCGGAPAFPPALVERFQRGMRGEVDETPKPGDPRLRQSTATVVGGRHQAMQGAADEAQSRGYHTVVIDAPVRGEAMQTGPRHLAALLEEATRGASRVCFVSSGETTVTVKGQGAGGRNQELALACAPLLAGWLGVAALASVGTDGVDGPTAAAGAITDTTTVDRAAAAGLSIAGSLADNDSHTFFAALGDLIHTGPTGTNVGDLQVLLAAP